MKSIAMRRRMVRLPIAMFPITLPMPARPPATRTAVQSTAMV
ncbi:MAG: hypothetical protein ACR2JW_09370 [Thermomicrobiales bacterium]